MTGPPRSAAWTVGSAATVPAALVFGWLVGAALQPPGYDPVRQTISVLAGHAAADRWVMTLGFVTVGVGNLLTAAGLREVRRRARVLLGVAGVAGIGVAMFAQPAHGSSPVHLVCAGVTMITLSVWPFAVVVADGHGVTDRRACWPAGVVCVALSGWLVVELDHGAVLGVAERAATATDLLWPLAVAVDLRRRTADPELHRIDGGR